MQRKGIVSQRPRTRTSELAGGIRLGSLARVDFYLDWSLLVIFALIALSLRFGLFPLWHPQWHSALTWALALAAATLFLCSVAVHELSHALVARHYGIKVQRITLFLFGGFTQIDEEAPRPKVEFRMAIAGPATSVLIGIIATMVGTWLALGDLASNESELRLTMVAIGPLSTLLLWLGPVNLLLGIFNMIPAFPLDGGRILRAFLWWSLGDLTRATYYASAMGVAFSWFLIGVGAAMAWGIQIPLFGAGIVPGLWLVLIGWFLQSAARSSYQDRLIRDALQDVTVGQVMRSRIFYVLPSTPIMALVRDLLWTSDQNCFPVVGSDDQVIGLLSEGDLSKVPRRSWSKLCVRDIMTPVDPLKVLSPSESAFDALQVFDQDEQIPVVEGRHLLGMIEREDIYKWITLSVGTTA